MDRNDRPLYVEIAGAINARENCVSDDDVSRHNTVWFERHSKRLELIEENCLPSGSGIDNGCSIDLVRSKPDRLVIETSFHHMNDGGYYDGWTEHEVIVTPSLQFGLNLRITGRDKRDIKNYLYDVFYESLQAHCTEWMDNLMLAEYPA